MRARSCATDWLIGTALTAFVVCASADNGAKEMSNAIGPIVNNKGIITQGQHGNNQIYNQTFVQHSSNEGVLLAANDPTPSYACPEIPDGALLLDLGGNVLWTDYPGISRSLLMIRGLPIIAVDFGPKNLKITALRLFDDRNNIIARIDPDGFWTDPTVRTKRPDASTLIVFDHLDNEALRFRFSNAHLITVRGIFRAPGATAPLVVTDNGIHMADGQSLSQACIQGGREAAFALN
jgi:hypothetical protein